MMATAAAGLGGLLTWLAVHRAGLRVKVEHTGPVLATVAPHHGRMDEALRGSSSQAPNCIRSNSSKGSFRSEDRLGSPYASDPKYMPENFQHVRLALAASDGGVPPLPPRWRFIVSSAPRRVRRFGPWLSRTALPHRRRRDGRGRAARRPRPRRCKRCW
jgi:hypothetical protein